MEGAASIFAAVSLTLQLIDTVKRVTNFLRGVQDAPAELLRLIDKLDQLQDFLDYARQLAKQYQHSLNPPSSTPTLWKALDGCTRSVESLTNIVNNFQRFSDWPGRVRKTWGSYKVYGKKDEIHRCQHRIRDATARLHGAILLNLNFMTAEYGIDATFEHCLTSSRMYHSTTSTSLVNTHAAEAQDSHVPTSESLVVQDELKPLSLIKALPYSIGRVSLCVYNGILGHYSMHK